MREEILLVLHVVNGIFILTHNDFAVYLKLRIPMMHRHFFHKLAQNRAKFKLFAVIEEIFFILHFANGIYMIIHKDFVVYLHLFEYK